ncbi:tetratricopeptide repeat protein [Thalassotalea agarivorans]|uniref:Putative thioredoxin n=1 Tax=Thalassotalea agarivorans TaxID=349064 RepID=A0A1I0AUA6_THASX|nr:tetratricopeptide repeat protein [Thalassotalea agarivorans]SES97134.1 putative thioredoxin [Thalassotalea agarivorans]
MTALTLENFQQVVLEDSKEKLILIAFWAQQVPESIELRDKLSSAVAGVSEHLTFATVDCEQQQQIAMQFGLQALPTIVLIKDGQPLDALAGPQPDEAVSAFLQKHLPKPEDGLLQKAKQSMEEGNVNEAFTLAQQAFAIDDTRADIKFVLIDAYIQTGKLVEAKALLETVTMVDQDGTYKALLSKLELAEEASQSPEILALEQASAENPDDVAIKRQLATQYSQHNRQEEALAILLALVQKDGQDNESKRLLLDVLKALPDGDPLAAKYRRKLYALMY